MKERLMIGLWRFIIKLPPGVREKKIAQSRQRFIEERGFMSDEHIRVHHFVVRELPKSPRPLAPETISAGMGLPMNRVKSILDDLQAHMTFLYRNPNGEVTWAYPVTVEKTPHRVRFSTGEETYAA